MMTTYEHGQLAERRETALLMMPTLPACRDLQAFNAQQVVDSDRERLRSLQQMSAGLAIIGVRGAVSGLVPR